MSLLTVVMLVTLNGCGTREPDYTTIEAEAVLNAREDISGQSVEITVDKLIPTKAFGPSIQNGEHLNFMSNEKPIF